jgi:acyl-homoserine-lactone acylase
LDGERCLCCAQLWLICSLIAGFSMTIRLFSLFFWALPLLSWGQVQPQTITIARDSFGVPHIFAPTDAGVAYGLAWATAEDDFLTLQEQLLSIRGELARYKGKSGAAIDIAVQWMQLDEPVAEKYPQDLSPEFVQILEAYAQGVNAYAQHHPEEVLGKRLFPVYPEDLVKGYMLGLALLTGVDGSLNQILNGKLPSEAASASRGSNAIAVSRRKTTDGKTYLAINSHQPLEGMYSWYEAHLCSEEGWNILGSTFPGGVTIFHGATENLGWAHTVNHPDLADIYRLEMHPGRKHTYRYDGQWLVLEKRKAKTRVKMGPFRIPVSKKYFVSPYGLTLKTDQGYFALRFPANRDIRAAEQWYRMNKAHSWTAFRQALEMRAIVGTHIVYADREDNIFYLSNGRLPIRNPAYDWQGVLPGDTSATLWGDRYFPLDSLPQVLNPASGFVYNTNNTPYHATGEGDNIVFGSINATMGYQETDNNRSLRFAELIGRYDKLSYEDFQKIKYDLHYHDSLYLYKIENLTLLLALDETRYPDLAEAIALLKSWNQSTDTTSVGASVFLLSFKYLYDLTREDERRQVTEEECVAALRSAVEHLQRHFGRLDVPWGEIQRHRRGKVDLAVGGGPDVLAAMYGEEEDGRYYSIAGESYIELVRFSPEGVEIESVNAYGASAKPESPHYTDQMQLYVQQKRKPMTLHKEEVLQKAVRIYHPQ